MAVKLTTDEFVKRSKKLWGNKFDYSPTQYTDAKSNLYVICKDHGLIPVNPQAHLRPKGTGCQLCGYEVSAVKRSKTLKGKPTGRAYRGKNKKCRRCKISPSLARIAYYAISANGDFKSYYSYSNPNVQNEMPKAKLQIKPKKRKRKKSR
tara:strand:- start:289 stop:738 length:450 start_codon:yes stop_codon:yes gene_type:complete